MLMAPIQPGEEHIGTHKELLVKGWSPVALNRVRMNLTSGKSQSHVGGNWWNVALVKPAGGYDSLAFKKRHKHMKNNVPL